MTTDTCLRISAPSRVERAGAAQCAANRAYRSAGLRSHLCVREPAGSSAEEVLGRFSDARCLLECALRSLSARDDCNAGVEIVCLRHGLELLRTVYNDFDIALLRRSPTFRSGTAD